VLGIGKEEVVAYLKIYPHIEMKEVKLKIRMYWLRVLYKFKV